MLKRTECSCLNILFEHKKKLCKKSLSLQNLSLNIKFQATYTTKLEFRTLYVRKRSKYFNA